MENAIGPSANGSSQVLPSGARPSWLRFAWHARENKKIEQWQREIRLQYWSNRIKRVPHAYVRFNCVRSLPHFARILWPFCPGAREKFETHLIYKLEERV